MGNISWKLYRNVRSSVMHREKSAVYRLASLQTTSKDNSICVASATRLSSVPAPRAHILHPRLPIHSCLFPHLPFPTHDSGWNIVRKLSLFFFPSPILTLSFPLFPLSSDPCPPFHFPTPPPFRTLRRFSLPPPMILPFYRSLNINSPPLHVFHPPRQSLFSIHLPTMHFSFLFDTPPTSARVLPYILVLFLSPYDRFKPLL